MYQGDELTAGVDPGYPAPDNNHRSPGTGPLSRRWPRFYAGTAALRPRASRRNEFAGRDAGIDFVVARLMERLDDRWAIFRSVDLPGDRGHIDLLLVGPAGLFILDVPPIANWRLQQGTWFRETGDGRWTRELSEPVALAMDSARAFRELLHDSGLQWKQDVRSLVVLVWDHPRLRQERGPHVWRLEELDERLADLRGVARLSAARVDQLVELLEQMLRAQFTSEAEPH